MTAPVDISQIVAAHFMRGEHLLLRQGDLMRALPHITVAYRLAPNHERSVYLYGLAALAANDYTEATRVFKRIVHANPDSDQALYHLASAFRGNGQWRHAERVLRDVLRLNPTHVSALITLAELRSFRGDVKERDTLHDRALAIETTQPSTINNQAQIRLWRGDFARGWPDYEARWLEPYTMIGWSHAHIDHAKRWEGQAVGTLLVYSEQGFGDAIQLARFLPQCAERCEKLIVQVQPSLVRLFQRLECVDEVIAHGPPPEHDAHAGMFSLPSLLGCDDVSRIPAPADFRLLSPPRGNRRIGLVWAGSSGFSIDADRSAPPKAFAPLLTVPGLWVCSLQKGERGREYETMYAIRDGDWLDTAEQITHCDLVIAVDTAVAHLAGSLGVPCWLIPPTRPEWRWLRDYETTSPWYPHHRLYRRRSMNDWKAVIERIRVDLEAFARG